MLMNKVSRFILFIFILGFLVFLGLIFSAWVVPNLVQPVSETAWLFLRVFFLTVDQGHYWELLLIGSVIWVVVRFARKKSPIPLENEHVRNEALGNLRNWQEYLTYSSYDGNARDFTRDKLLRLLISHYDARQSSVGEEEIRRGLELGGVPLPASVYNYLFLSDTSRSAGPSIGNTCRSVHHWYRRITGQAQAEYNRMIDELIEFLKS